MTSSGFFLFTFFLGCGLAQAQSDPSRASPWADLNKIRIDNGVAACLDLGKREVRDVGNVTLLQVAYRLKSSVAACGCTSAQLSYSVFERVSLDEKARDALRVFALVTPRRDGEAMQLVLASDKPHPAADRLKIRLGCASSD